MDPDALAAAGADLLARPDAARPGAVVDQRAAKLYMYLLPFVTVKQVRRDFLGQTEPFQGDDEIASDWAVAHPVASPTDSSPRGSQRDAGDQPEPT